MPAISQNKNQINSPLAEIVKRDPDVFKLPREGEVVEGALIAKGPRRAFFDLGVFGTGIVYGLEFLNAKDALKGLETGAKVNAKIPSLDGEGG